jgi:hypothetical protein
VLRDALSFTMRVSQIMKKLLVMMFVVCLTLKPLLVTAAGVVLLNKTVVVSGISATVNVGGGLNVAHEGYAVGATFQVAKGSPVKVACLTINKDFKYELTNDRGQVVPFDQNALDGMDITPNDLGIMSDCRVVPNVGQNTFKYLMLLPLYPNLASGTYTLHITFAPRGVAGSVELPPVQITVGNGHPPI